MQCSLTAQDRCSDGDLYQFGPDELLWLGTLQVQGSWQPSKGWTKLADASRQAGACLHAFGQDQHNHYREQTIQDNNPPSTDPGPSAPWLF